DRGGAAGRGGTRRGAARPGVPARPDARGPLPELRAPWSGDEVIWNVYNLALKEFLHLVRDRRTLAFLVLIPSVLTVIFGYAIGSPRVTGIRTRVLALDGGRIAYEFVEAIGQSDTCKADVRDDATEADVAQAEEDLLHDRISAFVVLPRGLSAALDEGRAATVRLVVDGSDTFMAPSAM